MLDYQLHNLDALELLKELRQVVGVIIPIVLVTGHGNEEIAAQALRLGANDYVVKSPGYLYQLPGLLENAYHHTELQRQQAALLASEERYRRLAENALDIIYRYQLKPQPGFEYVNQAAQIITGLSLDQFYLDSDSALVSIHPEDTHLLKDIIHDKFKPGDPIVLRWIRPNGELIWLETRNVPIYDGANKLIAIEGIARNITEHKLAEEQIQKQLQRLSALRTIDMAITSSHDLRITLAILLENVIIQLGVDAADILLFNPYTQMLEYSLGRGFKSRVVEKTSLYLGQGNAGKAAVDRQTICVSSPNDPVWSNDPPDLMQAEGFSGYCCTPLVAKSQIKGILRVFKRTTLELQSGWLDFLEMLAGQAAIAIDDAELFERLQHANMDLTMAYDTTLEGWVHALDLRDKETQGHTQRVTEMTIHLARAMGIEEEALVHVRRGALLHDIGKIGIPDNILHKPGPLTDEEWKIMRMHPVYAYELISPIAYLHQALIIPFCHHEKWDGTGYPRGLKGEQIPLEARIFAIIDVWDALTSDRPYRKAWDQQQVLEYIKVRSGTQFDPQIVEHFVELLGLSER